MEQTLIVTKRRADGSLISASRVDGACAIKTLGFGVDEMELASLRIKRKGVFHQEDHMVPSGGTLTIEAL